MCMPTSKPHPLAGNFLEGTGAKDERGYQVPSGGAFRPKDADGKWLPLFKPPRGATIEEATALLHEHIRTHGDIRLVSNLCIACFRLGQRSLDARVMMCRQWTFSGCGAARPSNTGHGVRQ